MQNSSRQTYSTPQVSIRPNCISMYSLPSHRKIRSNAQKEAEKHLQDRQHKGVISMKADKRIKNAIDWLIYLSEEKEFYHRKFKKNFPFRLCFVTLTLSAKQFHSDNEIKAQLLNQFLVEFSSTWKVKHYVWRAEPQKNGNIDPQVGEVDKCIYQGHCNGYIQRNGNIIQGKTNKNVDRFLSFQLLDVIV